MSKFSPRVTKSTYLNFPCLFFIVFMVLVIVGLFSIFNLDKEAEAAPLVTKLYGNAWSDNIGWISFNNCLNEDNCSGIDYSVEVDSNGDMSGAAWSDNIGWIKF